MTAICDKDRDFTLSAVHDAGYVDDRIC